MDRKDVQTVSSRGSKSRNKVSVGEPAEGSLPMARSEKSLVGILLSLENASRIRAVAVRLVPQLGSVSLNSIWRTLLDVTDIYEMTQLRTMDHSARRSMKNAANCVKHGELQGPRNRNESNAYCTFSTLAVEGTSV